MRSPPHPGRKRRLAGWTLLALAAAAAAVWAASGWWSLQLDSTTAYLRCEYGRINWITGYRNKSNGNATWRIVPIDKPPPSFHWRIDGMVGPLMGVPGANLGFVGVWRKPDRALIVETALWAYPLLLAGAGYPLLAAGRAAHRRSLTGLCTHCGYDKKGLAAGARCPECGK